MEKLTPQQRAELKDFVKTSEIGNEIKRAQVVLLLDEKKGFLLVQEMIGYSRTQAYDIRMRYRKEGLTALKDKRKGEPKELLSKKERDEIIEAVKTTTPKELGYGLDHWTTGFLGRWIEEKYGVKYKSKTSLHLVFRKATFTYHKPGRTYDRHDEREVKKWKRKTKPLLKKYWSDENTVILCGDEMILTTSTTFQKIWLPEGEFPKIICSTGGRKRRNVYGFLNLKSGEVHAFKTEKQNMYVTAKLLEQIRQLYPNKNIVLFWDNAGWHKGSVVQQFIKEDENILEIPFPKYAPEVNPQEHVWKQGRSEVTHNRYIEDIDLATDELISFFTRTKFRYSLLGFRSVS